MRKWIRRILLGLILAIPSLIAMQELYLWLEGWERIPHADPHWKVYAQAFQQRCPGSLSPITFLTTRNLTNDQLIVNACHDQSGNLWFSRGPRVSVMSFGCRGDGSSDDSACFASAQSLAESLSAQIFVPVNQGASYNISTGLILKRRTRIVCEPGAILKWTLATGTLFTWGADTDTSWSPGGMDYCTLQGNGGGSDTSTGVQIGNSTFSAHGVTLMQVDISLFGNGFVQSGRGDAFSFSLDRVRIHNNACNGLRFDISNAVSPETSSVINSMIFNNGNSSATCTGVQASASSGTNLRVINTHVDNNGNGTLGQFHAPSTGYLSLYLDADHFEHAGQADSTHIVLLSSGTSTSALHSVNTEFIQNPGTPANKPMIQFTQANVYLTNDRFTQKVGVSVTPVIDAGASVTGQNVLLMARNNLFSCTGTATHCQVVSFSGTATQSNYDFTGTFLSAYGSATSLFNIPAGAIGCHDLVQGATIGPTGTRTCTSSSVATFSGKRFYTKPATALRASNFALSPGWGTTATVTAVVGTDEAFGFTIDSSGTGQAANPTFTITFADGSWGIKAPVYVCKQVGGTQAVSNLTGENAAGLTSMVITFNGTPVAGNTVIVQCVGFGWR